MPKGDKLSPKQERFCREYLVDLNGTKAALRAGYTEASARTTASTLLANPNIRQFLDTLKAPIEQKLGLTKEYVLENLMEVVERCLQKQPVMVRKGRQLVQAIDENGEGVWKFDSMGANTALGLLGKHKKLFTDKIEIEDKTGIAERLDKKLKK